jgi:hypothetical protein
MQDITQFIKEEATNFIGLLDENGDLKDENEIPLELLNNYYYYKLGYNHGNTNRLKQILSGGIIMRDSGEEYYGGC